MTFVDALEKLRLIRKIDDAPAFPEVKLPFWWRILIMLPCLAVGSYVGHRFGIHTYVPFGLMVGMTFWYISEGIVESIVERRLKKSIQ